MDKKLDKFLLNSNTLNANRDETIHNLNFT